MSYTITFRQTGYSLWIACLRTADGRTVEGHGLTQSAAEYRARLKAAA